MIRWSGGQPLIVSPPGPWRRIPVRSATDAFGSGFPSALNASVQSDSRHQRVRTDDLVEGAVVGGLTEHGVGALVQRRGRGVALVEQMLQVLDSETHQESAGA